MRIYKRGDGTWGVVTIMAETHLGRGDDYGGNSPGAW
jgi:hypothetical protein